MGDRSDRSEFDARVTPAWFSDAKLGVFVHWGLYSIPAFADSTHSTFSSFISDLTSMQDTTGRNPYAEWYLNALRIPESPTARHHAATCGDDFSYFDFQEQFEANADKVDFEDWADTFADLGAEYVVLVARHLDGYPLWPTRVANPRMPSGYRSRRDLVGDLTAAVRARGLRMGLYYAGGTDWTFTDRPMRRMTDLMRQQSLGAEYARYANAQWRELIERYAPSIIWNDMGWPVEQDPNELFADYYSAVSDGVVNDRWTQLKLPRNSLARKAYLGFIGVMLRLMTKAGRPMPDQAAKNHFDVRTYEYDLPATPTTQAWELTRGLGNSFGFNAQETSADLLSGAELIRLFIDVVARGGRLLINVGPDGHGRIPEIQQQPLRALGDWLGVNEKAVFGTHPWTTHATETADGQPVRFTQKGDVVYAIVLADVGGPIRIPKVELPAHSQASLLATGAAIEWRQHGSDVDLMLPAVRGAAHVVEFR